MQFKKWLNDLNETVYYANLGVNKAQQLINLKKNAPDQFVIVQKKILELLATDWRDAKSFVDGARHRLTNYSDAMQTMGDSGQENRGTAAMSKRYTVCQKYQFRVDFTNQTRELVQAVIDTCLGDANFRKTTTKINNDWFNGKMARYQDETARFNCSIRYPNFIAA